MNKNYIAQLKRFQRTIAILDKNTAIWSLFIVFDNIVTAFKSDVQKFITNLQAYLVKVSGSYTKKDKLKNKLTIALADVCALVMVYALEQDNDELYEKVKYSKTDLDRQPDRLLVENTETLVGIVTPLLPNIVEYQVTQAMLETITETKVDFKKSMDELAVIEEDSKNQIDLIEKLITNNIKHIEKLKLLSVKFRTSSQGFFKKFNEATKLRLLPQGNYSIVGSCFDQQSLVMLERAEITLKLGEQVIEKVFTDDNGDFALLNVTEGVYIINALRPGYQPLELSVIVIKDKTTEIDIPLEKI